MTGKDGNSDEASLNNTIKNSTKKLSPIQFYVTQQCGTEPPFHNEFWNEKRPGIYVDVISGEPLFTSLDKFDSKTGWPSFTRPAKEDALAARSDRSHGMDRMEVRSSSSDSHLGHVFEDGPAPTGLRYCINSAALRFIPAEELVSEGYGEYAGLFSKARDQKGEVETKAEAGAEAKKEMKEETKKENKTEGPGLQQATATFAAGCFWGVEQAFKSLKGVLETTVGYTGGFKEEPRYEEVCKGRTGHAEAVQIIFDPMIISYEELLTLFWSIHDPTTLNRQGPDIGSQYRSAIFYHSPEQKEAAERSKEEFDSFSGTVRKATTEIVEAQAFYPAEDYHQDYFEKHEGRSCHHSRWR